MAQAIATSAPPMQTMTRGPKRSIKYPPRGCSQVSVTTKIVKSTGIAARPQWYFCSIGSMNSVQPYCRLAIITMQMMPRTSWPHRVHAGATAGSLADAVVISTPDRVWRCQYNSSLCSESLASRLTGPAAAMMESATSCGGERRLRLAVASLSVPRCAGHPWRGPMSAPGLNPSGLDPSRQSTVSGRQIALIVYILYFVSYFTGITALIGVIIAHVQLPSADGLLNTHYRFQIRTFWIG